MSQYRPKNFVTIDGLWLTIFTATLSAMLVSGLIWGIATHVYIKWRFNEDLKEFKALEKELKALERKQNR